MKIVTVIVFSNSITHPFYYYKYKMKIALQLAKTNKKHRVIKGRRPIYRLKPPRARPITVHKGAIYILFTVQIFNNESV